jgi:hypothetical protein
VCFATQHNPLILGINENKYFQSCHTFRDDARAGFESALLVSVAKVALPYLGMVRLLTL